MTSAAVVHVVMPEGVDDPARPSGGNVYDRRVCGGLVSLGWRVHEHLVPGCWPTPDAGALAALAREVGTVPDGRIVLLDGLVASAAPAVLLPEAARLRLVVLVHLPLAAPPGPVGPAPAAAVPAAEATVLGGASTVVTTSEWTRRWLLDRYALSPARVRVARPGVDPAAPADGTASGARLLCVGALTPVKGYDVLLAALASMTDLCWCCRCVGALDRDPRYVDGLVRQARAGGIADRVRFAGPRTGRGLTAAYAAADLLVVPSRAETYGMVVTEALARGLPVVSSDVGGVPEALGQGRDGTVPGLLVAPDDPVALAGALRRWLADAPLRGRLRRAARARRETLSGWSATCREVSAALESAAG